MNILPFLGYYRNEHYHRLSPSFLSCKKVNYIAGFTGSLEEKISIPHSRCILSFDQTTAKKSLLFFAFGLVHQKFDLLGKVGKKLLLKA